jgi:ribosomal protein L11 methyltransferase
MNDAIKKWFAVDIAVDAKAAESIESALNQLDALGTEIDDFRKTKDGQKCVTGFFDTLPDDADIRAAIDESIRIYGFTPDVLKSVARRVVEETDWLAEWKKYWKPTGIGDFVIAPPWESVNDSNKLVIRIEPNMAFGTGTHETTRLCLQAITDHYRAGKTFLDVGCGTGILAIAAARLAGRSTAKIEKKPPDFLAVDIDPDSIKIARANAAANDVGDRIEFTCGSIGNETRACDFVCANLTIDVIVPVLTLLLAKTRHTLVLSGILVEQKELIAAELKKFQISNFKIKIAGEWLAVIISMV